MVQLWTTLMIVFAVWGQAPAGGSDASPAWTPNEKTRLAREQNIESRIRLYEEVSGRHRRSLERMMVAQELEGLEAGLHAWMEVLTTASDDIESNVNRRRKSKNLIRFEIHLRKALAEVKRLNAGISDHRHETVETWLSGAEKVRKKLVDILFGTS